MKTLIQFNQREGEEKGRRNLAFLQYWTDLKDREEKTLNILKTFS